MILVTMAFVFKVRHGDADTLRGVLSDVTEQTRTNMSAKLYT